MLKYHLECNSCTLLVCIWTITFKYLFCLYYNAYRWVLAKPSRAAWCSNLLRLTAGQEMHVRYCKNVVIHCTKVHVLNLAGVNYFNMSTEVNVLIFSWVHIWITIIHKVNMLCIFCPHKIIASNFAVFQTYVNAMNEKIKKQASC